MSEFQFLAREYYVGCGIGAGAALIALVSDPVSGERVTL